MPTESELATVVHAFYAKVRADDLLGPLFNSAVDDWPEHLEKLACFWSSVMLTSGRYKGNPVAAHLRHADATRPEMFERWLLLWGETADELLPPDVSELIRTKASRIAERLKTALFDVEPVFARIAA